MPLIIIIRGFMTVTLKNVNTGIIWPYDGLKEFQIVNDRLASGLFKLINKEEITKEEMKLLEIPEIPKHISIKDRLLGNIPNESINNNPIPNKSERKGKNK